MKNIFLSNEIYLFILIQEKEKIHIQIHIPMAMEGLDP